MRLIVFCFFFMIWNAPTFSQQRFRLELRQTYLQCPGCGWLFDSTKLVVEHTAGTLTKTGPGMLVKQGGNRIGQIDFDLSSIPANARINKATLWMVFNRREGIANGDKSSVVKVYGWINNKKVLVRTLNAATDIKDRGYNKVNNNVPFDYTEYARNSINSSGQSQGGAPVSGAGAGAGKNGLPFKLSDVQFLHVDVKDWPVTSNLNVKVHGPFIDLNFDKSNAWKSVDLHPGEEDPVTVNANPWVFVNINGKWHAGTFEWMRPGNTRKHKMTVNGDHIKRPPLDNWSPVPGEVYYFMVSGLARQGPQGSRERTNIVGLKWPTDGSASESVAPSQIAPTGPSGSGSVAANPGGGVAVSGGGGAVSGGAGAVGAAGGTQTLTITCKSSKVMGLFKKKRICGGELFSKLVSYRLVEQIGDKYICSEGSTFGVHNGHAIWVNGCKGRFEVSGIPKGQAPQAASGANPNK